MKKIVILGDSLSLPRDELPVENTYPYLMNKFLKDKYILFNRSIRANDTKLQIEKFYDDVVLFNPDVIIIHLGIVDCAPRLFYRKERIFFSKINRLFPIVTLMNHYRYFFTKIFPKVYVKIQEFEKNYINILKKIYEMKKNVIIVGISNTTEKNKIISHNYDKNINCYNNILKKIGKDFSNVTYIDMYNYDPDTILLKDGIHLNNKGSKILAENILEIIKNYG